MTNQHLLDCTLPQRSKFRIGWLLGVAGLTAFLFLATTNPANAVFICAGPDWPDTCASGTDTLSSLSSHGTLMPVLGGPVFPPTPLPVLTGPAKIFRAAGTPPGHIDTEMVSLTLAGSGITLLAGDGTGDLICHPATPLGSCGAIDELPDHSGLATSFFDVFFEIQGTPLGPLHNNTPCRMQATIPGVPPPAGTQYLCVSPLPLDLFNTTNVLVARLDGPIIHEIAATPEPTALVLLGFGLIIVAAAKRIA